MRVRELSPPGRGAVSVLEVVGSGALEFVARTFSLPPLELGRITLARLRVEGEVIDEALALVTSSERIELHLHASPFLVAAVMRALDPAGASERAEACGSNLALARERLDSARSEDGARILLDQSEGALAQELDRLLASGEEAALRAGARELLERSRVADFALAPRRVVIAGPVNAGKSTLFNVLTGSERVVAAAEEGTTRDAIREAALLGAYPVELVDTAGMRALPSDLPSAQLERSAQDRARAWWARADLVLVLEPVDPGSGARELESFPATVNALRLASRVDLLPAEQRPRDGISPLREPAEARRRVARAVRAAWGLPEQPWQPGRGALLGDSARAELGRVLAGSVHSLRAWMERIRDEEPRAVAGWGAWS